MRSLLRETRSEFDHFSLAFPPILFFKVTVLQSFMFLEAARSFDASDVWIFLCKLIWRLHFESRLILAKIGQFLFVEIPDAMDTSTHAAVGGWFRFCDLWCWFGWFSGLCKRWMLAECIQRERIWHGL